MAHIAIFCDGTWNSAASGAPTHVLRLSRAALRSPEQIVLYVEGVGTGTGRASQLGRWLSRMGGGLFGWGLNRNIKSAYLALCQCYQPGDKILIFGFSRGAYTARSLAGMIRKCGILDDPTSFNLRRAFRLYRRRGARNAPDQPHIRAARQQLSPKFATSQADVLARNNDSYLVRIAYLGVWDTVGALGIPEPILGRWARWWNARYAFHDTRLSHLVETARHAVALDERRRTFAPSLWNNLDGSGGAPGLNQGDSSPDRPYQQMWFAGDHSMVGGSAQTRALSDISLGWIWEGAARQGLQLTPGAAVPEGATNPAVPTSEMQDHSWLYRWVPALLRWRDGPRSGSEVHDSVRLRIAGQQAYRPLSLAKVMPALSRLDGPDRAR